MEEAKEFLRQIKKIEILINNKQAEIDRLRNSAFYKKSNDLENIVAKVIDYERELNQDIDNLIDTKREVKSVIDLLTNADYIDILYKRYFQFETWERIAYDKNYAYQWLHKLHAKALQEVQTILNKR